MYWRSISICKIENLFPFFYAYKMNGTNTPKKSVFVIIPHISVVFFSTRKHRKASRFLHLPLKITTKPWDIFCLYAINMKAKSIWNHRPHRKHRKASGSQENTMVLLFHTNTYFTWPHKLLLTSITGGKKKTFKIKEV